MKSKHKCDKCNHNYTILYCHWTKSFEGRWMNWLLVCRNCDNKENKKGK